MTSIHFQWHFHCRRHPSTRARSRVRACVRARVCVCVWCVCVCVCVCVSVCKVCSAIGSVDKGSLLVDRLVCRAVSLFVRLAVCAAAGGVHLFPFSSSSLPANETGKAFWQSSSGRFEGTSAQNQAALHLSDLSLWQRHLPGRCNLWPETGCVMSSQGNRSTAQCKAFDDFECLGWRSSELFQPSAENHPSKPVSGCRAGWVAWLSGWLGRLLPECPGARLPGCPVACLPDCLAYYYCYDYYYYYKHSCDYY